jgi:ABC-2 type transport system ATP-binding protein
VPSAARPPAIPHAGALHDEVGGAERATAIEARDLVRRFATIDAVRGVTFEVAQGETFGFLGPNGAGKSTTISMLCTLLSPTSGVARVAGYDVVAERAEVRKRIGLVFQDTTLDDYLTAQENLRFHAELYGVPRSQTGPRIDDVLEMVGLANRRDSLVRTFSGGMKRRLEIARGLLHSPRVLFLDEPTVGLDPQTRTHIWGYIDELRDREAITIFLTTHYMDEAERVAGRIAVIDHGRIVALGSSAELKAQTGTSSLEEAFLALTGTEIREEVADAGDRMRRMARAWRGR